MSIIIPDLSHIPDQGPAEPGEYDLRVIKALDMEYDSGYRAINLVISVVGEDNIEEFWHQLYLPTELDDEMETKDRWRKIKDFMVSVDMDPADGAELDDFKYLEFSAELGLKDDYRDENKQVNYIKRIT